MTWLSINPRALSEETKRACAEILGRTQESAKFLSSRKLAEAFNLIDPEVCNLSASENGELVREEAENREWEDD